MRLGYFLLPLVIVCAAWGQDCAPSSLKYLADKYENSHATLEEWVAVCNSDNHGTNLDDIIPAWVTMTKHRSTLLPIFVADNTGITLLDKRLVAFREISDENTPVIPGIRSYLWVGIHTGSDCKESNLIPHCAVVVFHLTHVHMISPNSTDAHGHVLEEDFEYGYFFSHTLLVFDVTDNPQQASKFLTNSK